LSVLERLSSSYESVVQVEVALQPVVDAAHVSVHSRQLGSQLVGEGLELALLATGGHDDL
jgi:hypothetical protein